MLNSLFRKFKRRITGKYKEIDPEDIFIDSANLPGFMENRFEGRIEQPMSNLTFTLLKGTILLIVVLLLGKLSFLQIYKGNAYGEISENNRLEHTTIFSNRGVIYDRNMVELATNEDRKDGQPFANRTYAPYEGVSHVVGFLKYPSQDSKGIFYDEDYHGKDGAEKVFDKELSGTHGIKLRETDALGNVTSESVVEPPQDGKPVVLSIDAKITEEMYEGIKDLANVAGFTGGAGVIMDVKTGELLALTSYPAYDPNVMTNGTDKAAIKDWLNSPTKHFLDRAVGGLYTPGSIIKPAVALGALNEKIISPEKSILSTGSISIPNPYNPSNPSIFKDWRINGWTDMREAIAVSSDVYFYSIGGGYKDQKGLGITLIDKYLREFGLTEKTGIELPGELTGVIPTPEWKAQMFDGDPWRLGDTYITSIGQYGTQVTPLNAARYIGAIANGGKLLKTSILSGGQEDPVLEEVKFKPEDMEVVKEGMRMSVTEGTSGAVLVPYVEAAGKTGTAEIGAGKKYVHSWSVGFFPYDNPRYSWAIVMEKGPVTNTIGATTIMRHVLDWMSIYSPQYLEN